MHDLMLAKEILDQVLKSAKINRLKKISRLVVSLGSFVEHDEEILPENLKANVRLLSQKTLVEGAEIIIKKIGDRGVWRLEEIEGK